MPTLRNATAPPATRCRRLRAGGPYRTSSLRRRRRDDSRSRPHSLVRILRRACWRPDRPAVVVAQVALERAAGNQDATTGRADRRRASGSPPVGAVALTSIVDPEWHVCGTSRSLTTSADRELPGQRAARRVGALSVASKRPWVRVPSSPVLPVTFWGDLSVVETGESPENGADGS